MPSYGLTRTSGVAQGWYGLGLWPSNQIHRSIDGLGVYDLSVTTGANARRLD